MQAISKTYIDANASKNSKDDLRRNVLNEIKDIPPVEKQKFSQTIENNLAKKLNAKQGLWGAFRPLPSEPQLNFAQVSQTIKWCYPVVIENNLLFKKDVTEFRKNELGFFEPCDGTEVSVSELAGVIMPGLAFDLSGARLGRGLGYYDRALKNYSGLIIGVCFHRSLKEGIPFEEHDVKCQIIVTENQSVEVEGVKLWM